MSSNNLNEQETAALETFKNAVADVHRDDYSDHFYLRWLRARTYDPVKAEKMLRTSLTWREQFGADALVDSYKPPEVLLKYYPVGFTGHDREGCPVLLIPFGNCDLKGLLHSVKKSEYINYTIYLLEKCILDMKEQSRKLGRNIDKLVVIFDLENFGMKHITWKPAMDVVLYLVQLHEANYPEMLKKTYVVNTPKVFSIAYAVIRPFINDVTASKIKIYGRGTPPINGYCKNVNNNERKKNNHRNNNNNNNFYTNCQHSKGINKWRETILEDIDASEVPVHWGGTKTDDNGDPRCADMICLGGDVPQSYYMAPANRLSESENLQMATINKGSTLKIDTEVAAPGSAIRWEFKTEDYDVGFAVYRKVDDKLVEVVPKQRVNSHLVPEDGQFICSDAGQYVICFDNTFSLFRPKKISYTITVISPEDVMSGYDEIFGNNSGKLSSINNGPTTTGIGSSNGHHY